MVPLFPSVTEPPPVSVTVGTAVSSFVIVPLRTDGLPNVAPVGAPKLTLNVSLGSTVVSPLIDTTNVVDNVPAGIITDPDVIAKSAPSVGDEPLPNTDHGTVTIDDESADNDTV